MKRWLGLFGIVMALVIAAGGIWLQHRPLSAIETRQVELRQCLDRHMSLRSAAPDQTDQMTEDQVAEIIQMSCQTEKEAFLHAVYETQREEHPDILADAEAMADLKKEYTDFLITVLSQRYK